MTIRLDTTTETAYEALSEASARASVVVAALAHPVTVTVYDGSDVAMGTGTMANPWATASGKVITIGEVTSFVVGTTATPDANWYIQWESGARWVKGTFGLSGSGQDFTSSLTHWTAGWSGSLGTVTISAAGAEPPAFTVAPTSSSLGSSGGTIQFTAVDPNGDTVVYSLTTTRSGITIDNTTGLVTVRAEAAGTSGNIVVQASDGALTATATCAVTVASGGAIKWNPGFYVYLSPSSGHSDGASQRAADLAWFQTYASDPRIKGFYIQKYLSAFETGTVADYTAGFAMLDYYLGLCATYGKRLCVEFENVGFNTNSLPSYWQAQGWTHSYVVGSITIYRANTGISACRDRLIALIQAYAARYNNHPRLEIVGLEETTTTVPAGVTAATWVANHNAILTAAAQSWTNTLFRNCENGQTGDQALTRSVYQHVATLNAAGAGCIICGGPDHEDGLTNPLDPVNEKSWKQLWRGQTTSGGVTWLDARGIYPFYGETQERGFYPTGDTAANICTYQIDLMQASHVTFLNYTRWSEVYAAITARNGVTDTTVPTCLAGRTVTGGT